MYSTSKIWFPLFSFLLASQVIFGQYNPTPPPPAKSNGMLVRISIQNGNILRKRGPFFTSIDEEGNIFKATKAFSLEYGWQTTGWKEWQQNCKYPRMGIGVHYLRILNRDELGHPFSIYGFYDGNYFFTKNFQLTNRLAAGLAYGFETYNPIDNLPNDVISTKMNAFLELGTGFAVRLTDFLFIEPGFRFTHFSNGNLRKPQRGINIASYSIGVRSNLANQTISIEKMPASGYGHRHELISYLGMAPRQIEFKNIEDNELLHETYGLNFLMANLHFGYNFQVNHRLKLGGGADFFYDGTNGQRELAKPGVAQKSTVPFHDKIGLSIFIGGESAIDRLSIVTSLGYIVAQTHFEYSTPAFEQRLGFKYYFYQNAFTGISIRAYKFQAAKTIEFQIGMRKFI